MSWDDHQLKLTRAARLLVANPEEVFAELREISKEIRTSLLMSSSDSISPSSPSACSLAAWAAC